MLPHAEWHSPEAEIQDYSLHGGLADHSGKPLRRSGTRLWGIAEEVAGTFTSAGLRNLRSSEEGIFVWD